MAFNVGAIVSKLELNKKGWDASVKSVEKDQKNMAAFAKKHGEAMKKMGRTMTIAGAAILAGLGTAVKAFAGFDKSMTESLAIMGNVSEALRKEMADAAKQMSTESKFAAKELAEAYFFLASAGLDAKASIAALPVVTKFAQAGNFQLALATDLLTDAQSALGLSIKDDVIKNQKNMIAVSDLLVGANTLANASVQQFAESLTNRAAAALRAVNKPMEEGVAVLAAFADQGRKGSEAGMALDIVLRDLQKAARDNEEAFTEVGVTVFDSTGKLSNMGDIIGDLEVLLEGMSDKQKGATLATLGFQERSISNIKTLLGTSAAIKEYQVRLEKMAGITDEVSRKQLESFSNKMILVKNKITIAAISIGEKLAPTIEKMAATIGRVAKKITEWMDKHPKLTSTIVKLVTALGALMAILGPILMILPGIIAAVGAMSAKFLAATGIIGATVAVFGFTITKIIKLIKVMKELRSARKKANEAIAENLEVQKKAEVKLKDVATAAGLTAKEYENLKDKYDGNVTALRHAIHTGKESKELQEALAATATNLSKKTEVLADETEDLAKIIKDELNKVLKDTKKDLSSYSETITDTAIPATRDMSKVFEWATGKMEGDVEDFGEEVEATFVEVKNYTDQLIEGMGNAFGSFVGNVLSKGTSLKDNLKNLWSDMKNAFIGMIADMAKDFAISFVKKVITGALTANKAMEKTDKVFQSVGKSVAGIGEGIGKLISNLAKGIGAAIETLATSIANAARTLAAAAPQLLIVGGVALALMAGFKAIQALFGGGGGKAQDKATEMLQDTRNKIFDIYNELISGFKPVLLVDMQSRLDDHGQKFNWMVDQNKEMISIQSKILSVLQDIAVFAALTAKALVTMPTAQTGGYFPQETIVRVAEKVPEVIAPVPMLKNMVSSGGGGGGKSGDIIINNEISPVFNTLDPMTMRDVWRKIIEPEMIESLSTKGRAGTALKEALGLP